MIVDDHEVVREGIRLMAEQIPDVVVVGEASSGADALRAARTLEPDVVLMDIDMPEMDGVEAIRRLRSELPHIRTLVLTVHEEEDPIYRAVAAGASGYLPKSSSADEIRFALEALETGGSYLSREATTKTMNALVRRARAITDAARAASWATVREREILGLLARGWSTRRIAARLGISQRTVDTHLGHVYRSLDVTNRVDAVREAIRVGLVSSASETTSG